MNSGKESAFGSNKFKSKRNVFVADEFDEVDGFLSSVIVVNVARFNSDIIIIEILAHLYQFTH